MKIEIIDSLIGVCCSNADYAYNFSFAQVVEEYMKYADLNSELLLLSKNKVNKTNLDLFLDLNKVYLTVIYIRYKSSLNSAKPHIIKLDYDYSLLTDLVMLGAVQYSVGDFMLEKGLYEDGGLYHGVDQEYTRHQLINAYFRHVIGVVNGVAEQANAAETITANQILIPTISLEYILD